MSVPFLDLKASYATVREEIDVAIQKVLDSAAYALGPAVETFEVSFAAFCEARHAVGVGSGTEALWATLQAVGVGPGSEVITAPNTFFATAEAIAFCGATPVFVEIDEDTYTMDALRFEAAITPRTRAVIPVHLFGQPANMDRVNLIAKEHGLAVIEDACQAHGALYDGRRCGSLADAACFSFYPGKNLGAYGEAGAVVTDNDRIADYVRHFRDHGQPRKHEHAFLGWNARMDGLQGAVLSVKLRHLESWTSARRRIAKRYTTLLEAVPEVTPPKEAAYARHVYHLYVVRVPRRDAVRAYLGEHGVQTGVHYPVPIHLTPAFSHMGYGPGSLPVAERCAGEILSLPLYPELSEAQLYEVVETLESALAMSHSVIHSGDTLRS